MAGEHLNRPPHQVRASHAGAVDADHQEFAGRLFQRRSVDGGDWRCTGAFSRHSNQPHRPRRTALGVAKYKRLRRAVIHNDDFVIDAVNAFL